MSELATAFLALGVGYLWGRSDHVDLGPWRLRLGPKPRLYHVPTISLQARRGPAPQRPGPPSPDPDA